MLEAAPPFAHTAGSKTASLVLVGEAWGETEEEFGKPFAGYSGKELFRILAGEVFPEHPKEWDFIKRTMNSNSLWVKAREDWLEKAGILFTNVIARRPPSNNFKLFCKSKAELPSDYPWPPIDKGLYLDPQFFPEVERLRAELEAIRPNLIVALGNKACWALLGTTKISSIRGAITECKLVPGIKVLPAYHPAAIMRQWQWRPILVADLMKAKREREFPEIRRPERRVLVRPTLAEIAWFYRKAQGAFLLSTDVETKFRQIECVGFATSPKDAIVIPFIDFAKPGWSYWPTPEEEREAWRWVERFLKLPIPKVTQNGLYDLQYFMEMGLVPTDWREDTMILHHALYPELQKGLGFLGSIYTDESSWKLLRHKSEELKKDE